MENSHWLLFFFLKTNLYFTNYMYMPSGHTCQSGHYIHPFTWYQNIKCNVNTLFACIVLPENKILTLCLFIVSTNTLKCNSVANQLSCQLSRQYFSKSAARPGRCFVLILVTLNLL